MGYYVRVLSTSAECIPLDELRSALESEKHSAELTADEGETTNWEQLILSHRDGTAIAMIERNPVADGSLGADELAEFAEEVADCKPATGAQWLLEFFKRVQCIYAFQVLSGTEHENGWEILDTVKNAIWGAAPAISQADSEGFSNEEGYHILWQFYDSVEGEWWMAVLQDGEWAPFQMDLANTSHREAFLRGEIPS